MNIFKLFNFLTGITGVVLLFFVCISSSKSPSSRRSDVKFPEDLIVFPSEETFFERNSEESKRDIRKFHYSPTYFVGRAGHNHEPPLQSNPNFYDTSYPETFKRNDSITTIPLDFIQDINKFDDVNSVLENFVIGSDSPTIEDRFSTGERNAVVSPKSAGCMPELQTVKLASSSDASVLYIPQCTRIERCGGCCSHHLLECQPTSIQSVSFSVMKTQYVGGKKLKFLGKEVIQVDKHIKCKCDCKIKPEDCNRYQQYKKSECRCACINTDEEKKCYRKNQTKLWDPELCSCICKEVTPCSTGFEFDPIECKCAPKPNRNRYDGVVHLSNDYDN